MTLRTDQQATGMTKETERPMSDEQTKQERVPIDMLLYCPQCGLQHIDEPDERTPEWDNPPHRSHLCHACGCVWRPADVTTNGVRAIGTVGKADTWTKQERVNLAADWSSDAKIERINQQAKQIAHAKGDPNWWDYVDEASALTPPAAIDDDEVEREVHPALQAAIDHTRANIAAAFSARSKVNTAMRPHPDERVEVLVKALREIADYQWPRIVGQAESVHYGAATGEKYISRFSVPREQASQAIESIKHIARTALASVSTETGGA